MNWDDPENIELVRQCVNLLMRECSCKKGCKNHRSCRIAERKCAPGSFCCNCENSPVIFSQTESSLEDQENAEDDLRRRKQEDELVEDNECDKEFSE